MVTWVGAWVVTRSCVWYVLLVRWMFAFDRDADLLCGLAIRSHMFACVGTSLLLFVASLCICAAVCWVSLIDRWFVCVRVCFYVTGA